MSVTPVSSARTRFDDEQPTNDKPATTQERTFDFSGKAYAAITLPHGLLPSTTARPSLATIAKDMSDFQAKLSHFERDLSSPGMREWLSKHVEASKTGFKIGLKLGGIAFAIAVLKEKAVAAGFGIEVADKAFSASNSLMGLVDDVKTFARQLGEERGAAKAAHPDVVRVGNDLLELMSSGAKLASDMRRLAGT
jgi:hypothetical protein